MIKSASNNVLLSDSLAALAPRKARRWYDSHCQVKRTDPA